MRKPAKTKAVYTTGEVATICNISQQTVIRCFDNGKLRGFRVPGSRFRRIPRDSLFTFMREHGIPLDPGEPSTKRVLVIDDDVNIVSMLKDLLEMDGRFDVRSGATGFEAGLLARDFLPHVMLLDFKLPDLNGTVVCQSVRRTPELKHTRVIMISGVADPDEIEELLSAGADGFIKKPFTVDQVIEKIEGLVVV